MDFFDLITRPFVKSTKPPTKWKCRTGDHIIEVPELPSVCPHCRAAVGGIWLSMFDKVVD